MKHREIMRTVCERYIMMIRSDPWYRGEKPKMSEVDEMTGDGPFYDSFEHLLWMLGRIPELPPTKACRWLGFVQATIIDVWGMSSVDKERDATRILLREYDKLVCGEDHG